MKQELPNDMRSLNVLRGETFAFYPCYMAYVGSMNTRVTVTNSSGGWYWIITDINDVIEDYPNEYRGSDNYFHSAKQAIADVEAWLKSHGVPD